MLSFISKIFKKDKNEHPQNNKTTQPKTKEDVSKTKNPGEIKEEYKTFIAFDLETTGVNPNQNKIIEIGAVKVEKGEIIDTFQTFVNPGTTIKNKITKINGITNEMVKDAPDVNSALSDFLDFIGNHTLVAYNANFDLNFIEKNLNRKIENDTYDALAECKKLYSGFENYKLVTVADKLNVKKPENFHRALEDSEVTARIFLRVVDDLVDASFKAAK